MDEGLAERISRLERELDASPGPKSTWFLPPEREDADRLASQIALAKASPLVEALLQSWAGAIAVLNRKRQVVAINANYLSLLGFDDPGTVLGLRPGEMVNCVHANEQLPGRCGTAPACRTCGAAISILSALEKGGPVERDCALAVDRDGTLIDSEFRVRALALDVPPEQFILLSLVDVSQERRRAALERAFFHDLADSLMSVVGACDAMDGASPEEITIAAADARELAAGIVQELRLQRSLMAALPAGYEPVISKVPLAGILEGFEGLFRHHPVAKGKRLRISGNADETLAETDPYLVRRIVTNMLVNAFEASPAGAVITLHVLAGLREIAFRVGNPGVIPTGVAPRIFQRYYSTKGDPGRGQGTFVMKHFGEKVLRGRVGFTSTAEDGTTFELAIPRTFPPRV